MLKAPRLEDVLSHRNRNDGAACCILLAPLFSKIALHEVIPRIGYLDHRSKTYVHFYCAGYGGYGDEDIVPDMKKIGTVKYKNTTKIPWWFSEKLFADFVDELEQTTKWKYVSGNVELILLDPQVDFSEALVLNVLAMLDDEALVAPGELFESIIRYCRDAAGNPSAFKFSDRHGAKAVGKTIMSILPKAAQGLWKKGRHYAVKNLRA